MSSLQQRVSLAVALGEVVLHTTCVKDRRREESAINPYRSINIINKSNLVKAEGAKAEQSGENPSTLMAPSHSDTHTARLPKGRF